MTAHEFFTATARVVGFALGGLMVAFTIALIGLGILGG
jgi:hypothetical protein